MVQVRAYRAHAHWEDADTRFPFSDWDFWTAEDPTKGRVEYISADAARSSNISYLQGDTFFMSTDSTTVLARGASQGPGRKAVRIQSREAFSYYTMVVDVKHMPEGMGTWPALWSYGDPWPSVGELDIIEVRHSLPSLSIGRLLNLSTRSVYSR